MRKIWAFLWYENLQKLETNEKSDWGPLIETNQTKYIKVRYIAEKAKFKNVFWFTSLFFF